ncbi:substrate-binding domain-containing protein [Pseudomonas oryzihabitans]|uniref:substrate-binding domain-containing protein n=1 Tax=Pseudomonas oryzihabitans TaxID=47885 RepID=UPI00285D1548|nr:substrate-binding domain-containing protein [Pseudomonas psychrotolerans]MDR6676231.1 molybdate transport system substrate-binding protein [Pseudomonas psychrotolerans]
MFRRLPALALGTLLLATTTPLLAAQPTTLTVLSSGGIMGAIRAVAPAYEKATGVKLDIAAAPSMGDTPQAIPNRLARHEPADVVLMVGSALDKLIADGQAVKDSRVDLGQSFIAMAVRQGAPKPDISTMAAFKQTLEDAQSVAYSDSASGVYLSRILFPRMQLGEAFKAKAHMIPAEPVGAVVARGEAQLGFQQLSELKPVKGIDIVGLIPDQAQKMTLYSGAVVSRSQHPDAARALLKYLASKDAAKAIEDSGLKPIPAQ